MGWVAGRPDSSAPIAVRLAPARGEAQAAVAAASAGRVAGGVLVRCDGGTNDARSALPRPGSTSWARRCDAADVLDDGSVLCDSGTPSYCPARPRESTPPRPRRIPLSRLSLFRGLLLSGPLRRRPLLGDLFIGFPLFGGAPLLGAHPFLDCPLLGGPLLGGPLFGRALFGGPLFGSPKLSRTLLRCGALLSRTLLGGGALFGSGAFLGRMVLSRPLLRRPQDTLLGSRFGLRRPAMRAAEQRCGHPFMFRRMGFGRDVDDRVFLGPRLGLSSASILLLETRPGRTGASVSIAGR